MENMIYEAVNSFFKEIRMESETKIRTRDLETAELELNLTEKKYSNWVLKTTQQEQELIGAYFAALEHYHVESEQCSYFQGISDCIQLLSGLGVLEQNEKIKELLLKIKNE